MFALEEVATWQMPQPQPQRYHGRTRRSATGSHPTALGSAHCPPHYGLFLLPFPSGAAFSFCPTRGAGVSREICIFVTMTAGAHRATLLAC